jgi:hypothetical protein
VSREHRMSAEEQRLAGLLKRAVPEPPRQLAYEEITMPHAHESRKPWLMPALAAAAVVVIGVTAGAVAAHSSRGPGTAVAPSGTSRPAVPAKSHGVLVVPNMVGLSVSQAHHIAQAGGFAVEQRKKAFPNLPPGTVGAQSPAAGTTVPIYVTIVLYYAQAT